MMSASQFVVRKVLADPSGVRQWQSKRALRQLYGALINSLWYHEEFGFLCWSFREAGGICYLIAHNNQEDPADEGYGYMEYYCSVRDHSVPRETGQRLRALGFQYLDPETTIGYDRLFRDTVNNPRRYGSVAPALPLSSSRGDGEEEEDDNVWYSPTSPRGDDDDEVWYSPASPSYSPSSPGMVEA